jgi:hypothetical protein
LSGQKSLGELPKPYFHPFATDKSIATCGKELSASGMSNQIRVVITGAGVVSPIGIGREAFVESLRLGRSGVSRWDADPSADSLGPFLVARIQDFDGKNYIQPRKAIKLMSRELQTAYAASMLAFQDAKLHRDSLDADRIGTVFGSEMIYGDLEEYSDAIKRSVVDGSFTSGNWGSEGMRLMNPLWLPVMSVSLWMPAAPITRSRAKKIPDCWHSSKRPM